MTPREWWISDPPDSDIDEECMVSSRDVGYYENERDVKVIEYGLYAQMRAERDILADQLASITKDHKNDWKRIQDAERKCERLEKALAKAKDQRNLVIGDFRYNSIERIHEARAFFDAEIERLERGE